MGVFAIADFLEKNGFGVKIINYPLERYLNPHWTLESYLKNVEFAVCGIDLHWLHNAYGAIEIAKMVKKVNPNAKIILGGYSATYYHEQILKYYKEIDGIIRGDGEVPLLRYMNKRESVDSLNSVPNLSYRNSSKHIKINSLSYCAKTLDDLNFTNVSLLESAKEYFENSQKIMGLSFNLPIGRGCPFNCPFCGGGQRAQQRLAGRNKVILRRADKVIEDINIICDKFKITSIFFGHGTYNASLKYWKQLFGLIRKENLDIGGDLEIWRLPFPKEMWQQFYKTFPHKHSSISISPRTLSSKVHQKIAKLCDPTFGFPINQINDLIKNANIFNRILRIWLTVGYPFQTRLDILKDFNYGMKFLLKYGTSNSKPITMMSESYHIFPGSPAHEHPESFGITLKYNSFLSIVEAFKRTKMSHFYNLINYDKKHFSANSINYLNRLLFISTAPMFLTTGSNSPKLKEN